MLDRGPAVVLAQRADGPDLRPGPTVPAIPLASAGSGPGTPPWRSAARVGVVAAVALASLLVVLATFGVFGDDTGDETASASDGGDQQVIAGPGPSAAVVAAEGVDPQALTAGSGLDAAAAGPSTVEPSSPGSSGPTADDSSSTAPTSGTDAATTASSTSADGDATTTSSDGSTTTASPGTRATTAGSGRSTTTSRTGATTRPVTTTRSATTTIRPTTSRVTPSTTRRQTSTTTTAVTSTSTTPTPTSTQTTTSTSTTTTTRPTTTTTRSTTSTTRGGSGEVIWQDNFDRLDRSTWRVEHSTYGDGNNELQCYRPDNVSVSGGRLVLRAVTETVTCPNGSTRQVSSGMVRSSGVTFSPGQAIEFRVKLTPADPNDQGGLWPAVWASGWAGGGWPAGGELDWLEVMTAEDPTRAMFSMHYAGTDGGHRLQNRGVRGGANFSDAWHTVRFDYGRDGVLQWYLDGVLGFTVDAADTLQGYPAPFDQSIGEIKINLALGGRPGPLAPGAVGSTGATFEVDYIRIIQL